MHHYGPLETAGAEKCSTSRLGIGSEQGQFPLPALPTSAARREAPENGL